MGINNYSVTELEAQQTISGAEDGDVYGYLLIGNTQNNSWPCIVSGYPSENAHGGILPQPTGVAHEWVCDGSNVTNWTSGDVNTYRYSGNGVEYTTTTYTAVGQSSLVHMNWRWDDYFSSTQQDDEANQTLTNNGWYDVSTNYNQADAVSENFQYFSIVWYNVHP